MVCGKLKACQFVFFCSLQLFYGQQKTLHSLMLSCKHLTLTFLFFQDHPILFSKFWLWLGKKLLCLVISNQMIPMSNWQRSFGIEATKENQYLRKLDFWNTAYHESWIRRLLVLFYFRVYFRPWYYLEIDDFNMTIM